MKKAYQSIKTYFHCLFQCENKSENQSLENYLATATSLSQLESMERQWMRSERQYNGMQLHLGC